MSFSMSNPFYVNLADKHAYFIQSTQRLSSIYSGKIGK